MTQLKSMVVGGIFTAIIFMTIALAVVVASEAQTVPTGQALTAPIQSNVEYAQLTDAVPQRDITIQYFAPLGE
jgi:hypothetical protein